MSAAVDSIRLDLPNVWQDLPTQPDELRRAVAGARDQEAWSTLSPTERRRAELFLERFISDLQTTGARLVSMYSERMEGDGDQPGGQLVATCALSILDRAALGTNSPLTADVVVAAMGMDAGASDDGTITTDLEPARIVELTVGPAVRVVRLVEQRITVAEQLRVFVETFFVPVGDAYDQLVVLQFSTLNVEEATEFSQLFGALAATLRFYREGEPTEL